MVNLTLKVINKSGAVLSESKKGNDIWLVYTPKYHKGDKIILETDTSDIFCEIRLDDTMPLALVYVKGNQICFPIPFGEARNAYSPRAFIGKKHLITAKSVSDETIFRYRNLAYNPYDTHLNTAMFPHVHANIETRNRSFFAARNVIDGIYSSEKHGFYPYQSWGINQCPDAALTVEFGLPVIINCLRLTLRADFPHDNYWEKVSVNFSDGSFEELSLVKSGLPQNFPIMERTITSLVLCNLISAEGSSPFPALKQLEVWGKPFIESRTESGIL